MRAVAALLLGATIAVVTATALMHLVRTVLHYGCDFLVGGEAGDGSWACADAIGYILPGVSLVVPVVLVAVTGVILTFGLRGRSARRIMLGLGAIAPLTWAFLWSLTAAQLYVDRHPDSLGVWVQAVLPALVVALGGVLVLVVTPIRSPLGDGIVLGVGLALCLTSVVLQPGLTPVLAVSAAFGVAATRPMTLPEYVLTQ